MKAKDYGHGVIDIMTPQPAPHDHPRCSDITAAMTTGGAVYARPGTMARTVPGTNLGHRKPPPGAVAFPFGVPVIREDGTVVPGIVADSIAFTANPVCSLNPVLVLRGDRAAGPLQEVHLQ